MCNLTVSVASHLPFLFHIVTLLVSTGPLSLRASTHGLVINIIHSLCTCSQLSISGEWHTVSWIMEITDAFKECCILGKRGWERHHRAFNRTLTYIRMYIMMREIKILSPFSVARGSDAHAQAESDGVLPAQVLPVVRHQQGQVGGRECVPLQLPAGRPIVCIHASRAGTNVATEPRSDHRCSPRNHGGEGAATGFISCILNVLESFRVFLTRSFICYYAFHQSSGHTNCWWFTWEHFLNNLLSIF